MRRLALEAADRIEPRVGPVTEFELLAGVVRTVPGLVISTTATDVTDAGRIAALDTVDLLIVDRSLEPADNTVVIAIVDGELTVKRLSRQQGRLMLLPDNDKYQPMEIREDSLQIWGVVTHVVHKV